ncbi:MAG: rRNA maturation RNase YbeY [Gammaproteobacteria bacterium]|nr:rRNA maturation RNase YbeY [Gammaproteobacteria bacterium]
MTTEASLVVEVQIACDDSFVPSAKEIETWVSRAVAASGRNFASEIELSVRLVDREEMRTLNRDYRQTDAVTNVLSFPVAAIDGLPADTAQTLGDIVVCATVVSKEAAAQKKPLANHWAHMLVHGTLHLLGYDHETDADAAEMESLEARILTDYGLTDPYVESR